MERPPQTNRSGRGRPTGSWIAIGVGIGVALGAVMHNIGAGIAIGVALGVVFESIQNRRNR